MNELTVVTGLFDINRGGLDGSFKRDFSQYREWLQALIENIDTPLILYSDGSLVDWALNIANDKPIVPLPYEIYSFPFYDKVQAIRCREDWLKQSYWIPSSPQASLELYNPLVMSKQYMLEDAISKNPYESDYFVWLDAGVANTTPMNLVGGDLTGRLIPYLDKMLYLCFRYRGSEVHGFDGKAFSRFAQELTDRVVRATLFGGHRDIIQEITPLYTQLLKDTLSEGYMGTEENIFTLISYLYPDKVNLHEIAGGFISDFLSRIVDEQNARENQ